MLRIGHVLSTGEYIFLLCDHQRFHPSITGPFRAICNCFLRECWGPNTQQLHHRTDVPVQRTIPTSDHYNEQYVPLCFHYGLSSVQQSRLAQSQRGLHGATTHSFSVAAYPRLRRSTDFGWSTGQRLQRGHLPSKQPRPSTRGTGRVHKWCEDIRIWISLRIQFDVPIYRSERTNELRRCRAIGRTYNGQLRRSCRPTIPLPHPLRLGNQQH